jgi:tagatose-6-phosphate ketose/aldose isomerase
MDLLEEIREKKLAKTILVIAPTRSLEDAKRLAKVGLVLPLEIAVADYYRAATDVFVGQLLGLFASIKLGLKPDAPSPSGAISRVVSKVRIY